MKKMYLMTILVCTLLNGCAYNPIIDTAGKSGTFNTDQAKEITNDLIQTFMMFSRLLVEVGAPDGTPLVRATCVPA